MHVPETAVDKDDFLMSGQNNIRTPRQFSVMQAKSVSQTMHESSNGNFGYSVLASDARHAIFTLFSG